MGNLLSELPPLCNQTQIYGQQRGYVQNRNIHLIPNRDSRDMFQVAGEERHDLELKMSVPSIVPFATFPKVLSSHNISCIVPLHKCRRHNKQECLQAVGEQ